MTCSGSHFSDAPDIVPPRLKKGMSMEDLVRLLGHTSFEARNVAAGARLYKRMIEEGDVIWLGIAGAGIAGGMVIDLIEAGFIDVICSTGAQVYHDLHFAFDLPVKAINPQADDDRLRRSGDVRIYDIGIRNRETLDAQDALIRRFVRECHAETFAGHPVSSWEFNLALGRWVGENAPHPERSFTTAAARLGVPLFWDSLANHSIAMNLILTDAEGLPVILSAQKDILHSSAIAYSTKTTGFVELGGGGPKNFIQQTGPTIGQILKKPYEGAERGLQIGTAIEKEGSLSGCTFSESVTWGKYHSADDRKLVQIWGEYSIVFPLLAAYVYDNCSERKAKNIASLMPKYAAALEETR